MVINAHFFKGNFKDNFKDKGIFSNLIAEQISLINIRFLCCNDINSVVENISLLINKLEHKKCSAYKCHNVTHINTVS